MCNFDMLIKYEKKYHSSHVKVQTILNSKLTCYTCSYTIGVLGVGTFYPLSLHSIGNN